MTKFKLCLCYLHVICIWSVSQTFQHYEWLAFRDDCLRMFFYLILFLTLINPSAWLSAKKQAFINNSIFLLFFILSFAPGSSKIRGVLWNLYKFLDSISALKCFCICTWKHVTNITIFDIYDRHNSQKWASRCLLKIIAKWEHKKIFWRSFEDFSELSNSLVWLELLA